MNVKWHDLADQARISAKFLSVLLFSTGFAGEVFAQRRRGSGTRGGGFDGGPAPAPTGSTSSAASRPAVDRFSTWPWVERRARPRTGPHARATMPRLREFRDDFNAMIF